VEGMIGQGEWSATALTRADLDWAFASTRWGLVEIVVMLKEAT